MDTNAERQSVRQKEGFLIDIESTSEWRRRKAEEYPDDERNRRSAASLGELVEYVKGLDDGHLIFQALGHLSESGSEGLSLELSRYGFDGPEDPEQFLQRLATVLTCGNREPCEFAKGDELSR